MPIPLVSVPSAVTSANSRQAGGRSSLGHTHGIYRPVTLTLLAALKTGLAGGLILSSLPRCALGASREPLFFRSGKAVVHFANLFLYPRARVCAQLYISYKLIYIRPIGYNRLIYIFKLIYIKLVVITGLLYPINLYNKI